MEKLLCIKEQLVNRLTMVSTHLLSEVTNIFDRVILLHHGEIVFNDFRDQQFDDLFDENLNMLRATQIN